MWLKADCLPAGPWVRLLSLASQALTVICTTGSALEEGCMHACACVLKPPRWFLARTPLTVIGYVGSVVGRRAQL
jgi:hypothetical protein